MNRWHGGGAELENPRVPEISGDSYFNLSLSDTCFSRVGDEKNQVTRGKENLSAVPNTRVFYKLTLLIWYVDQGAPEKNEANGIPVQETYNKLTWRSRESLIL